MFLEEIFLRTFILTLYSRMLVIKNGGGHNLLTNMPTLNPTDPGDAADLSNSAGKPV